MTLLPPLSARISRGALLRNLRALRQRIAPGSALSVLVKSDAYGHGLDTVCAAARESGCAFLLVASLEEALRVPSGGNPCGILILGPIFPEEAACVVASDFAVAVGSLRIAKALSKAAMAQGRPARVHLKYDTGMGRFGFLSEPLKEAVASIDALLALPGLCIEGLMTHFSEADDPASDFTEEQIRRFDRILGMLRERSVHPRWIHAANSAGTIHFPQAHYTLCRVGISAFGIYPGAETVAGLDLEPVMSLVCRIADLRQVPADTAVSYGRTFITRRPSLLALLPVGYGHGYPRHASGQARVMIRGQHAPVLGRITMNLTVADVTDLASVEVGDAALLFGRHEQDLLRVEELAQAAGTIAYEIVCNVGRCAPRVVVD